ncbi:MAG TPA: FAD-dependent oxidoreductase, partial [Myxococcota bacterium]
MNDVVDVVDVAVIGAGFAGLSTTLTLAERGVAVTCLEALPYAGGCASTFSRHGVRYEAGATLFSGLAPSTSTHPGGFFTRALARHGLAVDVDWIDPVIEHRGGDGLVVVGHRDRAAFVEGLVAGLSADKAAGVRRFCARQQRVADLLWPILDDDTRLPPITSAGLWSASGFHLQRLGRYAAALPTLLSLRNKSVRDLLRDDGVDDVAPLRSWCRSLCQISVQTDIDDADAVFALCALDYVWRGTGHVRG